MLRKARRKLLGDFNWALITGQSFGFLLFTFWVTFSRRLQLFPLLDFPQCKFYYLKISSLCHQNRKFLCLYDATKYACFQFFCKNNFGIFIANEKIINLFFCHFMYFFFQNISSNYNIVTHFFSKNYCSKNHIFFSKITV